MPAGNGGCAQSAAFLVGFLGDGGGLVVADVRVQRRHQHQGALHQFVDAFAVGLNANGAVVVEAAHAIGQQAHALQKVVRHHGPKNVQLKVAAGAAHVDGHVVAQHLGAGHGQRFALGGIDLAGHDGRAGLVFWNADFANAAARAAGQPAHIVGDFHQAGGQGF